MVVAGGAGGEAAEPAFGACARLKSGITIGAKFGIISSIFFGFTFFGRREVTGLIGRSWRASILISLNAAADAMSRMLSNASVRLI